mgnify:CR=1 FL=1
MKTKILLGLIVLFSSSIFAQNVIRIRPQHQKEHIYTLKKNERIGRNESQLDMHLNGADYTFMTIKGNDYYRHTRSGKKRLVGKRYLPTVFKNWKIKTVADKVMVESRYGAQKYGPINQPSLIYDRSLGINSSGTYVTTKSDLYGFLYMEKSETEGVNGWCYYVVRPGENPEGPYLRASIRKATKTDFIYTFKTEEGHFLSENNEISGPYDALSYRVFQNTNNESEAEQEIFTYLSNGIWKADNEYLKDYTFSNEPYVERTKNGSQLVVKIIEKENKTFRLLEDGSLEEKSENYFVERNQKGEELIFQLINDTTSITYMNLYNVTLGDSNIGEFYVNPNWSNSRVYLNSDYFETPIIPADLIIENASYNSIFYFSSTLGLTKAIQCDRSHWVHLLDDGYVVYNHMTDSLLIGEAVYDKVLAVDFYSDPDNWWMIRSEGDLDQPYKNGKPTNSSKSMPTTFERYDTPDKPFIIVDEGEVSFIRFRKSKKLVGPVDRSSQIVISKDEKNYAECKRGESTLWINDKLISNGYYLVYNEKMDAFHWFSITDDNKIYLHTYELN